MSFVSSCPGNQPVVSVRFSHQFRESLLKAVFSRLYGGHFRPEKTELHRGSPRFYTKSPRSAEVRRGPPRSVSFYTRSRKSEKSEKFQEVMVADCVGRGARDCIVFLCKNSTIYYLNFRRFLIFFSWKMPSFKG